MSDFENVLRSAVDSAATATVTPPFGVVEHRASVRRRQQIAAVAAGITAVLAGGALAVPRIEARELQPTGVGGRTTYEQYVDCLDARRSPGPSHTPGLPVKVSAEDQEECIRRVGYEPPVMTAPTFSPFPGESGPSAVTAVVVPPPPTGNPATCTGFSKHVDGTVIEGQTSSMHWELVVEGPNDDCGVFLEPLARENGVTYPDGEYATNGDGGSLDKDQLVRWTTWETGAGETLLGLWGTIHPQADHVEFTVEGQRHRLDAVKQDGITKWTFMATMFPIEAQPDPDGWTVVAYDENGYELARY